MKRINIIGILGVLWIVLVIIACIFCLGSCKKKQASQKEEAQELVRKSHNKELNEMLTKFESYVKNNDKIKAVSCYEKVIGMLFQEQDYDKILSCSEQVLTLDTVFIKVYENMQYALWKKGQYEDALDVGAAIDTLAEDTKDWEKKHVNYFFTGMIAFDAKDYDLALNMLGAAIKDDNVVKEYGYLAYCYLSAIYKIQGNDRMADALKDTASKINDGAEEYIKKLVDREYFK
jgi:tetratricopeptide (TPR) repeat protein